MTEPETSPPAGTTQIEGPSDASFATAPLATPPVEPPVQDDPAAERYEHAFDADPFFREAMGVKDEADPNPPKKYKLEPLPEIDEPEEPEVDTGDEEAAPAPHGGDDKKDEQPRSEAPRT